MASDPFRPSVPRFTIGLLIRFVLVVFLAGENALADGLPSAAELADLWRERTRARHNAVIEWEAVQTTDPSLLFGKGGPATTTVRLMKAPFVRTLKCRLVADGERWKITESGLRWNNRLESAVPTEFAFMQDTQTYTILDDKAVDGADIGYVHAHDKGNAVTSAPSMAAYFLFITPFHPRLGQLSQNYYELSGATSNEIMDNHACVVLSFRHRQGDFFARVALAQDLDWLPVRFELGKQAVINFRYDSADADSILPSGWTTKILNATTGSVQDSTEATVTRWEFPPEIPDSEFILTFPTGTVVWDYRHRVEDVPENFLIREDGSHRPITIEERRHRIDALTLMKTEPNGAIAQSPGKGDGLQTLVFVNCAAAVAVILVVGLRCLRTHQR